ncbi:hypothetical protein [Bosea sp. RAC05]|uniref:hypothetical protein n=1 Tax=Bosea sp. RAC05 TaxID=1842539 RepID=UPI00083D1E08|nr:hypothetical protein [Bosea sp. RAC05]AOG03220.1 hypothetical protein BSY19_5054 [Bosea sp. RAC05]
MIDRTRPEYQPNWRKVIDLDGERITITANHIRHNRPARGHEIAKALARGRMLALVEERRYEWRAFGPTGRAVTLRETAFERIEIAGTREVFNTLDDALEKLTGMLLPDRSALPSP